MKCPYDGQLHNMGSLVYRRALFAGHDSPKASYGRNQMEGRALLRPQELGQTATTERGPPNYPKNSRKTQANYAVREYCADVLCRASP